MHEKSNITTAMDNTTTSEQNEFHNKFELNSFFVVILIAFGQFDRQYGFVWRFAHKQSLCFASLCIPIILAQDRPKKKKKHNSL